MTILSLDQSLFHTTISNNPIHNKFFIDELYSQSSDAGKFHIDIARRFSFNRFAPRTGVWTPAFPVTLPPGYEMPPYDPNFKKTFAEVTDGRAAEVRQLLVDNPEQKLALYYSGGIDSLFVLISLLKIMTEEEKSRFAICCSMDSVVEYPTFFEKYIYNKIKVIDLKMGKVRYNNLWDEGYRVVTADSGDAMFGTEVSTQFYYSYKNYTKGLSAENIKKLGDLLNNVTSADVHYSVYADILIAYFGHKANPNFGRQYYEKLVKLSNTSQYPIYSLHDFFWQIIFNIKWMHCALRGPLFFGDKENHERSINHDVINWFNTDDYQQWSMANNNTGQKIRGVTSATYKWVAREYIYEFTNDNWYKHFKLKLASLPKIGPVSSAEHAIDVGMRFGLDTDYNIVRFSDPGVRDYIVHHLTTAEIDW